MTDKISIIIPTYNASESIVNALNSIHRQLYNNYEVIVVDGLSVDNTVSIVNGFSDKLSNLVLVNEKDEGIYDAMNKGVQYATGTWLYFMGADDEFHNDRVLLNFFSNREKENYDIVYGNVYMRSIEAIYDGRFDLEKLYEKNICHQSIFFRKKVFQILGLYDTKYKINSDWEYNIRWWHHKDLKHLYYDEVIATFGKNGVSFTEEDIRFSRDKEVLFLRKHLYSFNIATTARLLKTAIKKRMKL